MEINALLWQKSAFFVRFRDVSVKLLWGKNKQIKGKAIRSISLSEVKDIERWINQYPRKILSYRTAEEYFYEELLKIYKEKGKESGERHVQAG